MSLAQAILATQKRVVVQDAIQEDTMRSMLEIMAGLGWQALAPTASAPIRTLPTQPLGDI